MKLSIVAALISFASISVDAQKQIRRRAKAGKGCKHEKARASFLDTDDDVFGTATVSRNEDCSLLVAMDLAEYGAGLIADMSTYPEYVGDQSPTGTVKVTFNTDGSLTISFDLEGLQSGCTGCGLHIHSGLTCDDANLVGGHYWDSSMVVDQWFSLFGAVYNSDSNGEAVGSFTVENGYGYGGNLGHAVVIHAGDGSRIGCGVLESDIGTACLYASDDCSSTCDSGVALMTLTGNDAANGGEPHLLSRAAGRIEGFDSVPIEDLVITLDPGPSCEPLETIEDGSLDATMSSYPGYGGSLSVSGTVKVEFHDDDTFKFSFDLEGLEADCSECGIHIHTGLTCDDASLVGGHYWDEDVVEDLWTATGGAVYSSDSSGKATGFFNLYNGYGYEENENHAVVIHAGDGSRIGCGVLG